MVKERAATSVVLVSSAAGSVTQEIEHRLREVFKEMPGNAKLRALLHEFFPALFIKVDDLPEEQKALGAGSRYHIAVLSPYGLTPMVTIDPVSGKPAEVVNEIVSVLERLLDVWRE